MAILTLTNGYSYVMGDTNYSTRLVAIGNGEFWYENPAGTMMEIANYNSRTIASGVPIAVIPAFQKVYIADGRTAANKGFNVVDFTTNPPTIAAWTASAGTMPLQANIGCLYRGRIVLSGDPAAPHDWFMTRQASPTDFLYAANDAQSAVAGNNAVVGLIGDIITALIPYQDDYLVMGCAHSIYLMRGDPAAGGSLDALSTSDGIFGPYSWCFDANGNLYFVGTGGVYKMERGGSIPMPLTATRLPKILDGISRNTHRITMGFDRQRHGIKIDIMLIASPYTTTSYWYDLRTDGFFPESNAMARGISCQMFYDADSGDYSKLILGCTDGYLRYYDDAAKGDELSADDDTAINSYVLLGPMDVSGGSAQSRINDLMVITGGGASNTDTVDYDIYVGNSVQEVADGINDATLTALYSGTLSGSGRKNNIRSKARGAAMAIKLSENLSTASWSIEKVVGNVNPAGRLKV